MSLKVISYGSLNKHTEDPKREIKIIDRISVKEFLERLEGFVANDIVLFLNAKQSELIGGFDAVEDEFSRAGCDVLFSASADFHYDDAVLRYYFWKFYPRFDTPYQYLDSNAFIGKASAVKALFNQITQEYPDSFSWHDLLTRFYVDYLLNAVSVDVSVKLDRYQRVFANVDGRRSTFKWPVLNWMHADLLRRGEERAGLAPFQDKLWDIHFSKKSGFPVNKSQDTKPQVYVTGADHETAKVVFGRAMSGKGKSKSPAIFFQFLFVYVKSLLTFFYALLINRFTISPYRIFRYTANKNPEWKAMMSKFLGHLERKEGFTFAHFNDGELTFIKKYTTGDHAETWFGRRQQKYNKQLGERLTKALKLDQENYYVGVPCSTHHPRLRKLSDELTAGQTNLVPAMSLHHNPRYFPNLINHMKDRPCYFVKNEYQNLEVFQKLGVEVKEENNIIVPFKNSYLLFDELKERKFPDGAIVILICGMLAKIIIPEWFERNPNTTFIALGSSMDDFIQRTNTKFQLYPKEGLPLTCNIQPTKFFAFGWKKKCKECWDMEEVFQPQ
ncbi:MAG: glycosyltransferase domain-containing protein [Cyclobacteriaceae bacterium]